MNRYFTKRRAKKDAVQPKFELDLTTALPSSDNFRTSLIMNSLSKRFSMLREQDDPNSLLGKASDDSVLAPRRQSRLMDFGYASGRTLDDIAEVSSINGSIRPPFAASNRTGSFASESGYQTDDDSSQSGGMMNRARPGEGNSLFGGRQKIYKIPMAGAASETSLDNGNGMKGRILYNDDVGMSTFQRWRQEERDRLAKENSTNGASLEDDNLTKMPPQSPSFPGAVTRHASTSTTSAPSVGRTSTAATSIASQSGALPPTSAISSPNPSTSAFSASPAPERSTTKSRRLYDQVLHRDIEEQQTNAITRLNSIQKNRGPASPTFGRSGSRQGMHQPFRSPSPPPSSATANKPPQPSFTLTDNTSSQNSPSEKPVASDSFSRHPLMWAISPNDRGKATAMGAFNKPQQFNERQYMERQLTLRQAQARSVVDDTPNQESTKVSMDCDGSDVQSIYAQSSNSGRSRAPTNASAQESTTTSAFSVFQNAASQMKAPPKLPEIEDSDENKTNFFFARGSSGTEHESNQDISSSFRLPPLDSIVQANQPSTQGSAQLPVQPPYPPPGHPPPQPPAHEHPAFRFPSATSSESTKPSPMASKQTSVEYNTSPAPHLPQVEELKTSETSLGLANGGLSSLIRQHLRQNSGGSSIYGELNDRHSVYNSPYNVTDKPTLQTKDIDVPAPLKNAGVSTPAESDYSQISNPFDLEDAKHPIHADNAYHGHSPVSPLEEDRHSDTHTDTSPKGIKSTKRRGFSQAPDTMEGVSWQQEAQKSHGRGLSSETIQEQDAFSSEIAKRQRALQERLKAKLDEVPAAPVQEERFLPGPFRGLDILRTKSSRESMKKGNDSPIANKPSKVFGMGPINAGSNIDRPSFQSDRWRSEETTYSSSIRSRSNSRPPTSRSAATKPYPMANGSDSGRTSDEYLPNVRDRKTSNPPPISALNSSARSRSNSVQSNGRSRSRNGRYKDDLEKAMIEGTSSRVTTQIFADAPTIPEDYPTPPIPNLENSQRFGPESASSPLKIQTNRLGAMSPSYFDSKGLYPPPALQSPLSNSSPSPRLPIGGHTMFSGGMSPRPSPGFGPASPNPLMSSARASPVPFPNVATPPMSGASTPIGQSFPSGPPMPSSNRARSQSRKRSIQKSDIGEPRLISTTSVIDTVELPVGASLRNGMEEIQNPAPPVPPINPLRRKFGFGKAGDDGKDYVSSVSYQQTGSNGFYSNDDTSTFKPRHRLRKSSSEGEKLGMRLRGQPQANLSNPALTGRNTRPPMEGGMF